MLIDFQVIPHSEQRYSTVGDWRWSTCEDIDEDPNEPYLHIRVSKLSDPRYELLVFHHELTEALLCREAGITEAQCDEWDMAYEDRRKALKEYFERAPVYVEQATLPCGCVVTPTSEPGYDPHAPYHLQHVTATKCEHLLADSLNIDWDAYEKEIEAL